MRDDHGSIYLKESQERVSKLSQHVIDLGKELVRSIQRSPSLEDRMGDLEDSIIYSRVVCGKAGDEVLARVSATCEWQSPAAPIHLPRYPIVPKSRYPLLFPLRHQAEIEYWEAPRS